MFKTKSEHEFALLEQKIEIPMVILTLVLLSIIVFRESQHVSPFLLQYLNIVDFAIYIAFVFELTYMTSVSRNKKDYLTSHWFNILVVLFPLFRVFRVISILDLGTVTYLKAFMRADSLLFRVIFLLAKALHNIKTLLVSNRLLYILPLVLFLVVFLGTIASIFEKNAAGANILNPYEGVWWGLTSITTVGYGDRYPVTLGGRIIGLLLMTLGITLFSILTANMSSIFIGKHEDADTKKILSKLDAIEEKVEDLEKRVDKKGK